MSIMFRREDGLPLLRRRFWSRMFGTFIRSRRQRKSLAVEEAARLAGMDALEWMEAEAGQVPHPWQLCSMAEALEIGYEDISGFAMLSNGAQGL
jgi:transcriptional regulator with XRE-family HTH domain